MCYVKKQLERPNKYDYLEINSMCQFFSLFLLFSSLLFSSLLLFSLLFLFTIRNDKLTIIWITPNDLNIILSRKMRQKLIVYIYITIYQDQVSVNVVCNIALFLTISCNDNHPIETPIRKDKITVFDIKNLGMESRIRLFINSEIKVNKHTMSPGTFFWNIVA